jgi:DNA modification methylase
MLESEADVLRTLRAGTYTLERLYELCEQRTEVGRQGGHDPVPEHAGDRRWKRRVRGALQGLRRSGRAERIGRSVWAIDGTTERPERLVLIVAGATPAEFELRLQAAVELLTELEEPADLVLADPPWGLRRGRGHFADGNGYRRDHTKIVPGYVDVDVDRYEEFTRGWVNAAASALRPAGQLVIITGPQRAAVVQCAAERAGLTWVSSIVARRAFALATLRRPASAHWTITVMCRGALRDLGRVFNPPQDLASARSGHPYPLDWWAEGNGRADRPGLARYDNGLPLPMMLRLVRAFSDPGEHVVDPFIGGGTTAIACWQTNRRFTGGDVNPHAVRFTAARLLAEHAWPAERQLTLLTD